MKTTRSELLTSAQLFCNDFSQQKDITTLLSHFSTTQQVSAFENGERSLASFLGRTFFGLTGVREYFETINAILFFESMRFSEFVVDSDVRKAAMKGKSRFTWRSTGESWDETFAYILDFDEENKIVRYQVWGDSGATYLASKGKLNEHKEHERQSV